MFDSATGVFGGIYEFDQKAALVAGSWPLTFASTAFSS